VAKLYVLLTVHLITIFVNDQLDAQFFFLYLFIPVLYMFRATKCSSSESQLYQYELWYMSLYVGDRVICRFGWNQFHPNLHITRSPTYSDIYQSSYWYNWLSWWRALGCSKHV